MLKREGTAQVKPNEHMAQPDDEDAKIEQRAAHILKVAAERRAEFQPMIDHYLDVWATRSHLRFANMQARAEASVNVVHVLLSSLALRIIESEFGGGTPRATDDAIITHLGQGFEEAAAHLAQGMTGPLMGLHLDSPFEERAQAIEEILKNRRDDLAKKLGPLAMISQTRPDPERVAFVEDLLVHSMSYRIAEDEAMGGIVHDTEALVKAANDHFQRTMDHVIARERKGTGKSH